MAILDPLQDHRILEIKEKRKGRVYTVAHYPLSLHHIILEKEEEEEEYGSSGPPPELP